jgi:hypothetical protein
MIRMIIRLAKAYAMYKLGKAVVRENGKAPVSPRRARRR